MSTTPDQLTSAGWKPLPDGRWQSPLTGHAYPERTARLLADLPCGVKLASQLIRHSPRRRTVPTRL